MKKTPEEIAALKAELLAKHGVPIRVVSLSDGRTFGFRPAGAADYRRWKAAQLGIAAGRNAEAVMASELAARALCVHPADAGASFDALRDEDPALAGEIGDALISRVGGKLEADLGEA